MKYLHPVAFVPNELIKDPMLHFTSKRIAVVLLHTSGRKGRYVKIGYRELAQLAGCSTATAQQAIRELLKGGYILKANTYCYSEAHGRMIRSANRYLWIRRQGGYTMIKKELLSYQITPAAFCSLLYLYLCAGPSGRAFPSLRRTAGQLASLPCAGMAMAKSTVCKSLRALRRLQALVRHQCRSRLGSLAANSYYLTDPVRSRACKTFLSEGSPNFDTLNSINQITKAFTLREKNKSWSYSGTVKFPTNCLYFDGTGVRVYFCGEQQPL